MRTPERSKNYDYTSGIVDGWSEPVSDREAGPRRLFVKAYEDYKRRLFPELRIMSRLDANSGEKRVGLMLKVNELQDLRDAMSSLISKLTVKDEFISMLDEVEDAVKFYNKILDPLKNGNPE